MSELVARMPPRRLLPRLRVMQPSEAEVRAVIEASQEAPFSYPYVGASDASLPPGWFHTVRRHPLGHGEAVYLRARDAMLRWRMFELPWVELVADGPPEPGQTVAFASRQYGMWGVHAVRVLDVTTEDDGPTAMTSFAYGTLPHHAVRGEERFTVTHDRNTGEVTFEIRQFSLPSTWLTTALRPIARGVQNAFVRDALLALERAVTP